MNDKAIEAAIAALIKETGICRDDIGEFINLPIAEDYGDVT